MTPADNLARLAEKMAFETCRNIARSNPVNPMAELKAANIRAMTAALDEAKKFPQCRCDEGFKIRKLEDPTCQAHDIIDEIDALKGQLEAR